MDMMAASGGLCAFFQKIVMEAADAVIVIDKDQRLVFFNPAAEKLFGHSRDDILGQELGLLIPPEFRGQHAEKVNGFQGETDRARYMGDRKSFIVGMRADGAKVPLGATIIKVEMNDRPYMVAIARDISERVKMEEELKRLASVDPLTGALNRRAFLSALDKEWSRAARYGTGLSLLMLDLDHFKRVNDTYGHDMGDKVIARFCELARSLLRDIDLLGRWGGEEFIIALPHSDLRGARLVAERIREAFAESVFEPLGSGSFAVTVSIGVADIGDGRMPHDRLIRRADDALYQAKAAGRDQVVVWNGAGGLRAVGNGTEG